MWVVLALMRPKCVVMSSNEINFQDHDALYHMGQRHTGHENIAIAEFGVGGAEHIAEFQLVLRAICQRPRWHVSVSAGFTDILRDCRENSYSGRFVHLQLEDMVFMNRVPTRQRTA